ncbi:MAG: hypothetical protein ISEC1_P1891 [Thiomicrorhabdus sp.]|nr:MAG: hypothetical protein ISEC1_P1891 [Thiomicrorhabdus sp.]
MINLIPEICKQALVTSMIVLTISPLAYAKFTPEQVTGINPTTASSETAKVMPAPLTDASKAITVTENAFVCLKKMQPVRGFFVDNLLGNTQGNLDATLAAANAKQGAVYPAGSIVQLIPTEVMIKHHKGWSPATKDWEFFELEVSKEGSKIKVRGTTQVINKFGGNCLSCHIKAEPQWDMICEENHGCDALPIPNFVIRWIQRNDPRCD